MRLIFASIVVSLLFLPGWLYAQNKPAAAAPPSTPTADPAEIIEFLARTISWYRELPVQQQLANQPSDLAYLQANRQVAEQVVQQAFDYARAQAQLRIKQRPGQQGQSPDSNQHTGLQQAEQKAEQQLQSTQTELQETRDKLAKAPASRRQILQSQVAELESEVGLLEARLDALQGILEFVNSSSTGAAGVGLRAQIEELGRSVPASLSHTAGAGTTSPPANPLTLPNATKGPEPTGIWGLISEAIHLLSKMHTLDDQIGASNDLSKSATNLRKPLLDNLRSLVAQGDILFAAADTASSAQLEQQKNQLDALTAQFKQTSASMLPLSKIIVLLDQYQKTLTNWREDVKDDLHDALRELAVHIGVLAVLIAVVIGIGEIWRRTTFRYVHEARRRYQFLLIRRIVMWFAIGLIVIVTFASQLGSAVTFAGLITAGVAVALQNVIVSIVAYFFLIGKYGIRVGDRVQIAGVTGEVVELGLVRIHLMELGGAGDSQPTGRVVAFSNSIVFQPTPGVFKQIPGTNFIWHELRLTLASETDYHAARERITQAVDSALSEYREGIEAQRQGIARNLSAMSSAELRPKVRLRYTASGIEATILFPVELDKASEIDDHLMKEVMAALDREPKLKLVGAEMPIAKADD